MRNLLVGLALIAMTASPLTFADDEPAPPKDNRLAIGAFLVSVAGVLGIGIGFIYAMPLVIVVMAFPGPPDE